MIQLIQLTKEELTAAILEGVDLKFKDLKEHFQPVQPSDYLSRNEVTKMLGINIVTLHNWTKKGILKSVGIGGRVYYLRSDIEKALIPLNK
jgi:predicted DNA-binding transcriptional regulator AlpA